MELMRMESSETCNDWIYGPDWQKKPRGIGWRSAASTLSGVLWLSFIIIWLFFYAGDYSVWENLGIVLLSLVVLVGVNAIFWVGFGLRMAKGKVDMPRWRIFATIISLTGGIAFTIVWLIAYANGYNVYQNLAVLLVTLLLSGGMCAAIWMGYDHRPDCA
jgi:cation transport ATPase